ncbi:MAG TPA: ADP-ribosylglycohydrolase family protein [Thermomicrobiales bacterium]|nr:ADP-ribosylglycohydrolase family protein [Thermomicrobiales bacterium]
MTNAREDSFLGALLGLAIGDALGRPLVGLTAAEIHARHGEVAGYVSDPGDEPETPPTGIITDETEVTLTIVESLTTNDGMLDPENINARLGFLIKGDSRRWMPDGVISGIQEATETDGLVPVTGDGEVDLSVAIRGVAVGLLHSLGARDDETVRVDADLASRLSHGGSAQRLLTYEVALATRAAALGETGAIVAIADRLNGSGAGSSFASIVRGAAVVAQFEDLVFAVVGEGGAADTRGALAGALAGARFGASGIPQDLIDHLDARIYLSLAAPWFYRAAMRRAGMVIDLRNITQSEG